MIGFATGSELSVELPDPHNDEDVEEFETLLLSPEIGQAVAALEVHPPRNTEHRHQQKKSNTAGNRLNAPQELEDDELV